MEGRRRAARRTELVTSGSADARLAGRYGTLIDRHRVSTMIYGQRDGVLCIQNEKKRKRAIYAYKI